ncbi:unnamed protein product [Closterium sp. Naga37s-1]|nr:unnamed protein product [Closterium sp. Naga37s-1]
MDLLQGCTPDITRQLVTARVWGRWERWRAELASLGGAIHDPLAAGIAPAAQTPPVQPPSATLGAALAPPSPAIAHAAPTPLVQAHAVPPGTTPDLPALVLSPAAPAPPGQATKGPAGATPSTPALAFPPPTATPPVQTDVVAAAVRLLPEGDEGNEANPLTSRHQGTSS